MRTIQIDNYIITRPIIDIVHEIKRRLTNGKLRDIKLNGDDIVVSCPHHNNGRENKAACNIYIGDDPKISYGFARCFVCDFMGPFEKFVAECFDSSIDYAKGWLIENFGQESENIIAIADEIVKPTHKSQNFLDETLLDDYQSWTPYLVKRKISKEIANNFKIKYDPKYRQVIFPVYDICGNLKMLAKRNIDTKVFYLDKNQEKEVYGLNIIQKNNINSCIITEGPFDMLSGWTNGVPTVATLGNISDYQIEQINKSCIKILYLAFDNDEAGKRFNSFVKSRLDKRILAVDVEIPASKKDLNDLDFDDWEQIKKKYFNFQ